MRPVGVLSGGAQCRLALELSDPIVVNRRKWRIMQILFYYLFIFGDVMRLITYEEIHKRIVQSK